MTDSLSSPAGPLSSKTSSGLMIGTSVPLHTRLNSELSGID